MDARADVAADHRHEPVSGFEQETEGVTAASRAATTDAGRPAACATGG
jgi:hypothetical protein